MIDINGPTPQVSQTSPMAFGRRQFNLTVLADGSVLATGGNSSGAPFVDMNAGVYPAELWNPGDRQLEDPRLDGRHAPVPRHPAPTPRWAGAIGRWGVCGTCDQVGYLAKNAEIFTPPYLYKKDGSGQLAPRPDDQLGAERGWIRLTDPDRDARCPLDPEGRARPAGRGDPRHNMEQRYVPLKFTPGTGMVRATIPASVDVVPPGDYMLFIINADGVPSVAKMVQLDPTISPPPPPSPPKLTGTSPRSPANDNHPEVTGTLGAGSPTLVSIYTNRAAPGSLPPPAARPSSREAASRSGSRRLIDPDQCHGRRTGGDSGCSNSISYVESTSPPNTTFTSVPPRLRTAPR